MNEKFLETYILEKLDMICENGIALDEMGSQKPNHF